MSWRFWLTIAVGRVDGLSVVERQFRPLPCGWYESGLFGYDGVQVSCSLIMLRTTHSIGLQRMQDLNLCCIIMTSSYRRLVMHDGADIVGDVVGLCRGPSGLIELVVVVRIDIFPENGDVVIAVWTVVFVQQAKRVSYLVHHWAPLYSNTAANQSEQLMNQFLLDGIKCYKQSQHSPQ